MSAPLGAACVPLRVDSPRLVLRLFEDRDWQPLHAYYGDADSTRYTLRRALTEAETWRTVAGMVGHWVLRGYGPYAIVRKGDDAVIGTAGLWFPNDWPEPEIKWALVPAARGRGYAREAAAAVRAMARAALPGLRLISLIDRDNAPSIKVATSIGATFEREIDFRDRRAQIYRHAD